MKSALYLLKMKLKVFLATKVAQSRIVQWPTQKRPFSEVTIIETDKRITPNKKKRLPRKGQIDYQHFSGWKEGKSTILCIWLISRTGNFNHTVSDSPNRHTALIESNWIFAPLFPAQPRNAERNGRRRKERKSPHFITLDEGKREKNPNLPNVLPSHSVC
jgi:hypothetical protein